MIARTILSLAALTAQALAIPTIQAKGAKFFTSDGNQFYVKGIAYQLTSDDPLVDNTQCSLDANLMKTLGTNAIRVYHVDPTQNHDACMATFADAGIYLFLDLDTFSTAIESKTPTWTQSQHDAFAAVMDTFQKYDNLAGFFVGNEVLTSGADSVAAPFVKAAAVDMKAYRDAKGYRKIPIGYSAADIPDLRPNLQNYLACGSDPSKAVDFYSLNAYEWCGASTFETSGYSMLQENASSYNIPIFFSETGCIIPPPRFFTDQSAILGPQMEDTWSGAIIYEWIEEVNNYGLISYGPPAPTGGPGVVDGFTRQGTPTPIQPDFSNLGAQWKTLNPTGVQMAAYTPSFTAPACPGSTAGLWEVNGDVPLPTIGESLNAAASNSVTAAPSSITVASSSVTIVPSSVTSVASSFTSGSSTTPAPTISSSTDVSSADSGSSSGSTSGNGSGGSSSSGSGSAPVTTSGTSSGGSSGKSDGSQTTTSAPASTSKPSSASTQALPWWSVIISSIGVLAVLVL